MANLGNSRTVLKISGYKISINGAIKRGHWCHRLRTKTRKLSQASSSFKTCSEDKKTSTESLDIERVITNSKIETVKKPIQMPRRSLTPIINPKVHRMKSSEEQEGHKPSELDNVKSAYQELDSDIGHEVRYLWNKLQDERRRHVILEADLENTLLTKEDQLEQHAESISLLKQRELDHETSILNLKMQLLEQTKRQDGLQKKQTTYPLQTSSSFKIHEDKKMSKESSEIERVATNSKIETEKPIQMSRPSLTPIINPKVHRMKSSEEQEFLTLVRKQSELDNVKSAYQELNSDIGHEVRYLWNKLQDERRRHVILETELENTLLTKEDQLEQHAESINLLKQRELEHERIILNLKQELEEQTKRQECLQKGQTTSYIQTEETKYEDIPEFRTLKWDLDKALKVISDLEKENGSLHVELHRLEKDLECEKQKSEANLKNAMEYAKQYEDIENYMKEVCDENGPISELRRDLSSTKNELARRDEEFAKLCIELAETYKKLGTKTKEALEEKLERIKTRLADRQLTASKKVVDENDLISELQRDLSSTKNELAQRDKLFAKLCIEFAETREKLDAKTKEIEALENKLERINTGLADNNAQLTATKKVVDENELISELQRDLSSTNNELAKRDEEFAKLCIELAETREKYGVKTNEMEALKEKLETINTGLADNNAQFTASKTADDENYLISELQRDLSFTKNELAKRDKEFEKLCMELGKTREKLEAKKNKMKVWKENLEEKETAGEQ